MVLFVLHLPKTWSFFLHKKGDLNILTLKGHHYGRGISGSEAKNETVGGHSLASKFTFWNKGSSPGQHF